MFACITDTIPAEHCIFIDDQPDNITAAAKLGFGTILVNSKKKFMSNKPNIQAVRAELQKVTAAVQEEIYA